MRYGDCLRRFWLLLTVLEGVSGGWRRSTSHPESSLDAGNLRRLPVNEAMRDVPPMMLELFSEYEPRLSRRPSSVVRSFYDQDRTSSNSRRMTSEHLEGNFVAHQMTSCLHFNLSEIPSTETTHRAELHLYLTFDDDEDFGNRTSTILVAVYRATRRLQDHICTVDDRGTLPERHLRLVGKRTLTFPIEEYRRSDGKWISFVVSRVVARWRRRPEKNFGFVVVWTKVDKSLTAVNRHHAYLVTYGDDRASSAADLLNRFRDLPVSRTTSAAAMVDGSRRERRHSKRSRRSRQRGRKHRRRWRNLCRRRSMYVDFGEIGWDDWIVAPPGFEAFYCAGDCPFYLPEYLNTTNHAIVQSLIHSIDNRLAPRPCCVPTQLSQMSMLYVDNDDNVVLKNYQEMVVEACGCR